MKLLSNKTLLILLVLISGYGYIASCTRDNELPPPPATTGPIINHGTNVHLPGSMTVGNNNEWKVDKAHSSVLWSTNYVGAAGLLTGRFNQFGVHDVTDEKMLNYHQSSRCSIDRCPNPPPCDPEKPPQIRCACARRSCREWRRDFSWQVQGYSWDDNSRYVKRLCSAFRRIRQIEPVQPSGCAFVSVLFCVSSTFLINTDRLNCLHCIVRTGAHLKRCNFVFHKMPKLIHRRFEKPGRSERRTAILSGSVGAQGGAATPPLF